MAIKFPFEQLPADEPDYDAYDLPEPCPFCMEVPCECEEDDTDANT